MTHKPYDDSYQICKEILSQNKSVEEWAEIESDEMFQTTSYEGGFDATAMEFCFSVFIDTIEYWFQLSLHSIREINENKTVEISIIKSDW